MISSHIPGPVWFVALSLFATNGIVGAGEKVDDVTAALSNAAGISLSEVVSLKEIDSRPGDGNLYIHVALKHLRKTGTVVSFVDIIKVHGGMRAPGTGPPPPDGLLPVPFEKGKAYWFVWSSPHEWQVYDHQLIRWWPRDAEVSHVLDQAVTDDRFAWEPHREPKSGVTYDHHYDAAAKVWRMRGTKDGKVLWDVVLDGEPENKRYLAWGIYEKKGVQNLAQADDTPSSVFLSVVIAVDLTAGNRYELPPGRYWMANWYEMETGRRAAGRFWNSHLARELASPSTSRESMIVPRASSDGNDEPIGRSARRAGRSFGLSTRPLGRSPARMFSMEMVPRHSPGSSRRRIHL